MSALNDAEAVVLRVKRRAFALGAAAAAAAFFVSARAGASLTICAAVVISSLLVLEKATDRIASIAVKPRWRTLVPLLLVTAASFVLLGLVLWRWKDFDPIAGAVGLSVVVLAIVPELWIGR